MNKKTKYQQPVLTVVPQNTTAMLLSGSDEAPEYINRPTAGFMSNPDVGEYGE